MAKSLLLVTADTNFGQILLYGLEQAGYPAFIVKGKGEAVVRADEKNSDLAFLDLDLGIKVAPDIGMALRALKPEIRLVVFSRETDPPPMEEIRPWTLMPKPYYLPDVLNMLKDDSASYSYQPMQTDSQASNQREVHTSSPTLPWLQDVSKAAQHLTRLTLESSAQAALITRGEHLWAYAGQLSQGAAKELAVTVTRHWDGQKGSDLLRFVRLEATRAEHMLYATRIADDVVLALVFDAETPFSTIRTQASQLAQSLSITAVDEAVPPAPPTPVPASYDAQTIPPEDEENGEMPSIADILADVPPPQPDRRREPAPAPYVEEDVFSTRPSHASIYSQESSPAVRMDEYAYPNPNLDQTVEHVVEDLDATMPSQSRRRPETPIRRPRTGELDETRPHSITEVAGRVMLEPVSAGMYHLAYACLLIPRFSNHFLTGDVSDRLSEWLPQICIAFGWRLEYLAVRPEYIQWVVNVPPSASPGYLMRVIRQQTSEKLFGEFPRLKKENPSGDFWAPGYLIMGGTQPHPPQLVKDHIRQTRTRQGYSQPKR